MSDDSSDFVPNFDVSGSTDISDAENGGKELEINVIIEEEIEFDAAEHRKGRKRSKNPENHKKNIRKYNRMCGKNYVSSTGRIVSAKQYSKEPCGCKMDCVKRINGSRREQIFKSFYNMNWSMKNSFLACQIEIKNVERKYTEKELSRRQKTRIYRLQDEKGVDQVVCKKYFKETIAVCDGTITNALKRKKDSGVPQEDRRGKHSPYNKTKSEDEKIVCDFINKFPAYDSHYCRRDNERKYLSPDLNTTIMYNMYMKECTEKNIKPVSLYIFRHIFNTKFNLHFHQPRKDTCQTCDEFKAKVEHLENGPEKDSIKQKHELHLRKAEAIKTMKKSDIAEAEESNGERQVLVFDLQKTLPTPILTTNVIYYKRQLWVYNLGIHDEVAKTGHMYVWKEHVASRGAQEISSCLFNYIKNFLPTNTKQITLYSDSCGGQNRNIKLTLMLMYILENTNIEKIDLKFFVPGHSFSTCDQDFAIIEKQKRFHSQIYHPDDWISLIENSKKKEPKFIVHQMTNEMFFSTKCLENNITNRKVSSQKQKVEWFKMRWIQVRKNKPKVIFFKTNCSLLIDFEEVDIAKKGKGRPSRTFVSDLDLLYPDGRKISKEKKKDLLNLLKFIPPVYHEFYKSLSAEEANNNEEPTHESNCDEEEI